MKLKYTGTSKKITFTLPIGAPKRNQTGKIDFLPGEIVEIDDENGQKILDSDSEIVHHKDLSYHQLQTEKLIDLGSGKFKRQRHFQLIGEKNEEETIQEETTLKKRGRPKKVLDGDQYNS